MSFKSTIPVELFDEIADHILGNCKIWQQSSWNRASAQEERLTGDFWNNLCKDETRSYSSPDWNWGMTYKTVRGTGRNAPETSTGADGIFEVVVYDQKGNVLFQKSFLFQAKMEEELNAKRTRVQVTKMNGIASEGSVVVTYGKYGFRVIRTSDYLTQAKKQMTQKDLCKYIVSDFFECRHGQTNMFYDMRTETLHYESQGLVKTISPKDFKTAIELKINPNKNGKISRI